MRKVEVGIIGLGTVGEGTLEILTQQREMIHKKTGVWVDVTKACDLDIDKTFGFDFDKEILTTDYMDIMNDDDISIVVELIGGYTIAKDIIETALKNKKHVVTANKALIAKYGKELFELADENNVKIYYEASVGGGIPVITPLQESLVGNNLLSIKGIINGTANYILTEMSQNGVEFKKVLKEAQRLGYAEADPTFDIEGIDTAHKISILASLAYGGYIDLKDIYVKGITEISKIDTTFAKKLGYEIKLLACAKKENEKINISVEPTLINKNEILANVNGVYNSVEIVGDYVGKTMFYGKGAGMKPTGSAVVGDVVKLATEDISENTPKGEYHYDTSTKLEVKDSNEVYSEYYIRLTVKDIPGVLATVTKNFQENEISIKTVDQHPNKSNKNGETTLIIITHEIKKGNLSNSFKELKKNKNIIIDNSIMLKILN
ncbi:MAG: homoserine dehydrogenase [Fusobacteriota bacterium]